MVVFVVSDLYGVVDVFADHGKAIDKYNALVAECVLFGDTIVEEVGFSSHHPRALHETRFAAHNTRAEGYNVRLERWDVVS